jgi:alpha-beta hydrolase superfamily lysophospholipase
MGALVAASWGLLPGRELSGFVFSSPWFRPAVDPPRVKVLLGRLVGKVVPWFPVGTGLRPADLTSDEAMQDWTDRDPLYGRSTTPRWFEEATRAQAELLGRVKEFRHPVLVLAGGADPIADAAAAELFADQAGSEDKAFKLYPGFRHELFNERERERPVAEAVAWIAARS